MIKNYFKIAWRTIIRNKGYSIINVAGLGIGIAACLLIFVVIKYELSFDTDQPNYKNIYHLVTESKAADEVRYNPGVPDVAPDALRLDFPGVKIGAVESSYGSQLTVPSNNGNALSDKKFTENIGVAFTEPQYFDIIQSQWLAGNAAVLNNPDMVVLDKSTAAKYFGDWQSAMGKILKMDNVLTLKVAGVVADAPSNTDFPLKVMVSYVTWKAHPKDYGYVKNWGSIGSSHEVFLILPPGMSADNMNAQLKTFSAKHFRDGVNKNTLFLQPLSQLHFDTRFSNTLGDHITSMATLRTLSFIGILIIIMAAINFINLSTAQSVGRSKEVGIRKVLGSNRRQLIIQVIGETSIIVFAAVALSLIIGELALPYLQNIASVPDTISLLNGTCLLFLAIVMVSVIVLSGLYPALVISGFKPVLALKNKITAASVGGIPLRRTLVVAQFAISQLLIIGTIIAVNQMDFVNNADLGFNKSAILIIPGYTDSVSLQKMQAFKQQVLQNPQVLAASFTADAPSSDNDWGTNIYFNHSEKDVNFEVFEKQGDADYFKTFELRFAAGKGYDQSDTMRQAVINETLLNKLGYKHPDDVIGKTIKLGARGQWAAITGVVKDFKTNSLREAVKPIVLFPNKSAESEIAVKIDTKNLAGTVASVQKLWETTYPEYAYNGYFLDDNIAQFYKQENQMALIYKVFAIIAIFISCLGLYGLISFMAIQRTKEVGIRKVLGASVSSIVYLFSKEFAVLIFVSFIIAMPASWYIMSGWLQNFVYRISLSAWVFVLAIIVSVVIAFLTVGYKAIKAALANPVKSLRSE